MIKMTEFQIAEASQLDWYHALDFGDYQTVGRVTTLPHNVTLFGVMDMLRNIDVRGKVCLDIGPAHGLISHGLAMRGANVTAVNIGGAKPRQFSLAEEIYGHAIEYISPLSLENCPKRFGRGSLDLIVCAGVMYHLLNPADVFFRLRPLLKKNGLLIMETVYAHDVKEPVILFNSETGAFRQPTTYFIPSATALHGMAKLASFDVVASRHNSPARYSLTGKAVLPHEVQNRTEFCATCHEVDFEDPLFNLSMLNNVEESTIVYMGERGHKHIDVSTYIPDFPSHPKSILNPLGSRIKAHLADSKL